MSTTRRRPQRRSTAGHAGSLSVTLRRLATLVVVLAVIVSITGLIVTVPGGSDLVTVPGRAIAFGALGMFSAVVAAVLVLVSTVSDS